MAVAQQTDDDLDGPWKESIELFPSQVLELFAPEMHREIDWSKPVEFRDKELSRVAPKGKAQGLRVVDKLLRVQLRGGAAAWVLIHIEVQSQRREDFSRRMFHYFVRLRLRHEDMPVVSLAILGDASDDWRPNTYTEEQWGCALNFRYPIVKLSDFASRTAELEAMRNPVAAVVLAHLAVMETRTDTGKRLAAKLALVRNLYRMGYDANTVLALLRLIDWLVRLPDDLDDQWWDAVEQAASEDDMTYVSSFERRWLSRGRAEGKAEGKAEGEVEAKAAVLADWALALFGTPAAPLAIKIRSLRNRDMLDAVQAVLRSGGAQQAVREIVDAAG
jgi:hypothetical protein